MAKLDRLGWAAGLVFTAYGLRIGIRVNCPDVLPRLGACLPFGWEPAATPVVDELYSLIVAGPSRRSNLRRYNLLYAGPFRIARTENAEEVFPFLETELQLQVAERARRRLFVHAGVVGWRGRAIVLPGSSQRGKSTLVAALL